MSVEILGSVDVSSEAAEALSVEMAEARRQWKEQVAARILLAHIAGIEPTVERKIPCNGTTSLPTRS